MEDTAAHEVPQDMLTVPEGRNYPEPTRCIDAESHSMVMLTDKGVEDRIGGGPSHPSSRASGTIR
ncbi:hypothetical protein Syun_025760 [Stephania yunnanensis]|uniref:Uncharacterized protein n=1 Tax=Stephania yunnanensis TaxID=152371 RepID=A0AAP0HWG2_9MAGN